ncbi:hypothetical protein DFH07DRAFT_766697 [Mycena maculata]|uniref:Uncharacterized protein n=1 Tax=Mycena maculata TaxID=230809 RepID=A0AAD7K1U0_9AGAR|nr:hypothetical protein DFH07DRAFT_766697 [Mycena maculata]
MSQSRSHSTAGTPAWPGKHGGLILVLAVHRGPVAHTLIRMLWLGLHGRTIHTGTAAAGAEARARTRPPTCMGRGGGSEEGEAEREREREGVAAVAREHRRRYCAEVGDHTNCCVVQGRVYGGAEPQLEQDLSAAAPLPCTSPPPATRPTRAAYAPVPQIHGGRLHLVRQVLHGCRVAVSLAPRAAPSTSANRRADRGGWEAHAGEEVFVTGRTAGGKGRKRALNGACDRGGEPDECEKLHADDDRRSPRVACGTRKTQGGMERCEARRGRWAGADRSPIGRGEHIGVSSAEAGLRGSVQGHSVVVSVCAARAPLAESGDRAHAGTCRARRTHTCYGKRQGSSVSRLGVKIESEWVVIVRAPGRLAGQGGYLSLPRLRTVPRRYGLWERDGTPISRPAGCGMRMDMSLSRCLVRVVERGGARIKEIGACSAAASTLEIAGVGAQSSCANGGADDCARAQNGLLRTEQEEVLQALDSIVYPVLALAPEITSEILQHFVEPFAPPFPKSRDNYPMRLLYLQNVAGHSSVNAQTGRAISSAARKTLTRRTGSAPWPRGLTALAASPLI